MSRTIGVRITKAAPRSRGALPAREMKLGRSGSLYVVLPPTMTAADATVIARELHDLADYLIRKTTSKPANDAGPSQAQQDIRQEEP